MKAEFFVGNRQNLAQSLQGGLIVLTGYGDQQRGNDAAHPFEQEANFWYVTGIEHPDWKLILDGSSGEAWLVAPSTSTAHELFDGSLAPDEAIATSGVKHVLSSDEGDSLLRRLGKKHTVVYTVDHPEYSSHFGFHLNPSVTQNVRKLERIFASVRSCNKELAKLRAIKQPEEITMLKRAAKLTVDAFSQVHTQLRSYHNEYEVEAEFTYHFRRHGARHAYDPIVAGGKNACTLHYGKNQAKLKPRSLLLLDVGARTGGYPADVTRTYAIGEATKRQRELHDALEKVHHEIIAFLEPGLPVADYMRFVDERMKAVLIEVKLLRDSNDDETYRRYFPHAISHGLGVDVHDSLGAPRVFEPGMVLTVEPGIYIPGESIGIRIEDDILISDKGRQNLTGSLSTGL